MDPDREPADRRRSARRLGYLVALMLTGFVVTLVLLNVDEGVGPVRLGTTRSTATRTVPSTAAAPRAARKPAPTEASRGTHQSPIKVARRVVTFVDATRVVHTASGATEPRTITTIVRYPVVGAAGTTGMSDTQGFGRFPLIVFGHGFSVTPGPYSSLLDAWTRAGYVVAAPVFPLGNANAPGGPNEQDLPNQPADMSFVIASLLSAAHARSEPYAGLIDPNLVAVAGQSDGGDTALAVAYDQSVSNPRVGAAVILSGAEDPFAPKFVFPPVGPPLLAVQGTADTINPPSFTTEFFSRASPPKYRLDLVGASHQAPYTEPGPQLRAVERMTIAFLDRYLKHKSSALQRYISARTAGGDSTLSSAP